MPIRVLIIDDSVFMRSMLKSAMLSGNLDVIATAQNGTEGLKKIKALKPDVVTLDVEMPGMTGLEVLEQVMKECPLPIVMVSTKTQAGAKTTLEALELGAVDFVAKPLADKSASLESFRNSVLHAVETAFAANRKRLSRSTKHRAIQPVKTCLPPTNAVVAIGISAGGPATLHKLIPFIPKEFPPIVITQHMPADFTGPFAVRLNDIAKGKVKEAAQNDTLLPGTILIAPGDRHLRVTRMGPKYIATVENGPKVAGFRPSVDVLFESVASAVGAKAVGIVMTGMGCDGSVGVRLLKKKGARTLAQDKETSIVYGMPKAAAQTGFIDRVIPLEDIPNAIAEELLAITAQPAGV